MVVLNNYKLCANLWIVSFRDLLKDNFAYVLAIIKRKNDIEDKLVVCNDLNKYNKDQIKALVEFKERFFESTILMFNENITI